MPGQSGRARGTQNEHRTAPLSRQGWRQPFECEAKLPQPRCKIVSDGLPNGEHLEIASLLSWTRG